MDAGKEVKKAVGVVIGTGLAVGVTVFAVWVINYGISIFRTGGLNTVAA